MTLKEQFKSYSIILMEEKVASTVVFSISSLILPQVINLEIPINFEGGSNFTLCGAMIKKMYSDALLS
jgi:hypothetical protein